MQKQRLHQELSTALQREHYEQTEHGVYFPRQGVLAQGEYFDRVNGGEWQRTPNLVTDEGLQYILNVALGKTPKPTAYYIALFNGSASPANNWTASNFASVASEIVSLTEGYSNATRPQWTPSEAKGNAIDSMEQATKLTIATTSQLNVTGTALLTHNVRGGTSGVLISATKYPVSRTFQNGDIFEIGYRLTLSSS